MAVVQCAPGESAVGTSSTPFYLMSNYPLVNPREKGNKGINFRFNRWDKPKGITLQAFSRIIHRSSIMTAFLWEAGKIACSDAPVLIQGETGVGKELLALAIHEAGARKNKPFIAVNCAAIPDSLIESELFGYEEGAFTGAKKGGKPGKFELASGGTLFLDEIGDASLPLQSKLLRVLQEMEFERVGGTHKQKVDVRIIAATNRDLSLLVHRGQFREDLYYRLNVLSLTVPPLRDRKEDISLLVEYYLNEFNRKYHRKVRVSKDAMEILENYSWPGNVRELKNLIEKLVVLNSKDIIYPFDLPPHMIPGKTKDREVPASAKVEVHMPASLKEILHEAEKQAFEKALSWCQNNRTQAMKLLGISRRTFYKKLAEHFHSTFKDKL